MSKYDLDTKKMAENGDLLLKEIDKFNSIVSKMFSRVINMPYVTKEWEGKSAINFAKIAKKEKEKEFDLIISTIKKYAYELKNAGQGFENVERSTKAYDKNITDNREFE